MIRAYYKSNCATSLSTLRLIRKQTKEKIEKIEYLVQVPSAEELRKICRLLKLTPGEFIRRKEPLFNELYEGKNLSDEEWIAAMREHPILIDRPVVIRDGKAVLCRPAERVLGLFM